MDLLRNIWDFFQYQILGMKWLNELIGGCLGIFGIDEHEQNGVTVPNNAAITLAFSPRNRPSIFFVLSGGK